MEIAMAKNSKAPNGRKRPLRSQFWFNNPDDPHGTALYFERYLNFGYTKDEITSGRPIIGIAQSGSDLSPCNRHHLELANRVRDGIRDAGGGALELPMHPSQGTGQRPPAPLGRHPAQLPPVAALHR